MHRHIDFIFSIRPTKQDGEDIDPFETNTGHYHYDDVHADYLYQEKWVEFVLGIIT